MTKTVAEQIKETVDYLKGIGFGHADFGLILGSGLGDLANEIENPVVADYADIPNFPSSKVAGHAGKLVYGTLAGKKVIAMQGRFHFYEGHTMQTVTLPVRVMKSFGADNLIVTNAAGGVSFGPGTLMLISDHINFTGDNPLIGENLDEFGPRFPDMSEAYSKAYREVAKKIGAERGITLAEGVYMGFSGPTYETPAEIRMAEVIGADAVGMSTVPEVIVAKHSGMNVLGISAITNHAAGKQAELNHEEVVEVTTRIKSDFQEFVKSILAAL
ncbi:purine-nucleoside phosphorylase [Streptococcaceae bacterium ESL0687]|nr:purine-nucleoside phosphorylase [Streptococcaceae bacterium ESL0687]